MSDHVLDLLGAYLDGELQGGGLRRVAAHLEECRSCMDAFQDLQALSAALHEAPAPEFPAAERLAAEVILRIPRKQVKPVVERAIAFGWWLVPVALVLAWVFFGTTQMVSRMVVSADTLGLLDNTSAWLVTGASAESGYTAFLGQMGVLNQESMPWFMLSEGLTRTFVSSAFWQVSITLLYLGWMAIWWARHTRRGSGQPSGSNGEPIVR